MPTGDKVELNGDIRYGRLVDGANLTIFDKAGKEK